MKLSPGTLAVSVSLALGFSQTTMAEDIAETYQNTCVACHLAGVAGAPRLDDKAAWAPRLEKGTDALLASVKNGMNAMPPGGTCASCTDEQFLQLIEMMTENVK